MDTQQSDVEQQDKSRGLLPGHSRGIDQHAQGHADHRLSQGFTVLDLISEFRAARASVMRLWINGNGTTVVEPSEIERFNEAMDEALHASANAFEADLERSREMFLGILGHDMRGPLGAIVSGSQVLAGLDSMPELGARVSARIYSSSRRLNGMLNDLLDFTRTRLGRDLPVNKRAGDMGETVSGVVTELRMHHPAAVIKYETSGDLHGTWDFSRLAQLVSNLGGNAIQHGDRSRPIAIRLQGEASRVVLSVYNEGPPIPAKALGRIFQPLIQGNDPDQNVQGSIGLGLYISKQVALAHGGTIEVRPTTVARRSWCAFRGRGPALPRLLVDGRRRRHGKRWSGAGKERPLSSSRPHTDVADSSNLVPLSACFPTQS